MDQDVGPAQDAAADPGQAGGAAPGARDGSGASGTGRPIQDAAPGADGGTPADRAAADGAAHDYSAVPGDLQGILLGGPVRYSAREVAAAARMTLDEVSRLWRAMGFPDVGAAQAFTEADLAALLRISALMERGLLDLDSTVEIVRSFGQTTSRLAEWQLDTVSRYVIQQDDGRSGESPRRNRSHIAREQAAELVPEFERLLAYVWRRQLAAVLGRLFDDFGGPAELADTATVGFADLVGFTRLSRQLDHDSLAVLVHSFETAASDIVHAAGGRLIKTLGDEVMFVSADASVTAGIAVELHSMSRADPDMPGMRIGLATGAVLMRMGDVFGTTVNRASRLTAAARPGSTLMDAATSDALSAAGSQRYSTRAQAPRRIRGLGLMRPYALTVRAQRGGDREENPAKRESAQQAPTRLASADPQPG